MPALTPRWKPIAFDLPGGPANETLFEPVLVSQGGVLVAGGRAALTVFDVSDRPGIWYTVPAHVWINGFAVSGLTLYVQDGPVLAAWSLVRGGCIAALNLVTEARWSRDDDGGTEPPASIYTLPPAASALQERLLSARLQHLDALHSEKAAVHKDAREALNSAIAAAATIVFSPPAVRTHQLETPVRARIFSLDMNGAVYAIDNGLEVVGTFNAKVVPLRPELAIAEIVRPSQSVLCHLYYVAKDGGIVAFDATEELKPLPGWRSSGKLPVVVAPLRYRDQRLWGGGILDQDFFAIDPISRNMTLTVKAPKDGAWTDYDISVADKLLLITNGQTSRLVSYDPDAKQADRWGERKAPAWSYSFFWQVLSEEQPPPPPLALEIDLVAGAGDAGFRVLLANTVDSSNMALTPDYPPTTAPLGAGTFGSWQGTPSRIAWQRCRPVIAQNLLLSVVRSAGQGDPAGKDFLVAYSMLGERTAALNKSVEVLADLRQRAQPLRIAVQRHETYFNRMYNPPLEQPGHRGPWANASYTVNINPGGAVAVKSGGDAVALVSTKYLGGVVTFTSAADWTIVSVATAKLERGKVAWVGLNVKQDWSIG